MRNYLRISPWGIFYLYGDTAVRFSIGEQILDVQEGATRDKTLSKLYRLSAGIEPGLLAVLPQGVGFQVGINLIGVSVEWENGSKNYVEDSQGHLHRRELRREPAQPAHVCAVPLLRSR